MNVSMKWLSDYVSLENTSPKEFSDAMTMSGSKVEGYEVEGAALSGILVGRVRSIEKHPDADSLFVCKLDMGAGSTLQIITAATNVVAGALVPVATHGAVLADGKVIKSGKLRGLLSEGMLCSLEELGLTVGDFPYAEEDGIFLIEEPCAPGDDIRNAIGLNDTVVEFEITSNRPDCLSMIGLAREASATFGVPLNLPEVEVKATQGSIRDYLSVTVENTQLCPRYLAMMVRDVKVAPSPRWLRERLRACGVRPINNIVDITNFVMLEYGQPMHAFDYRHVKGGKIIVRNAGEGESITTLDGVARPLSPEMLVIADGEAPSAIAGVMGGEYSSIEDDTSIVVFESANFERVSIRTTSRKLGLRTESSSRYEKGMDPAKCAIAALRACQLVEMLGAGTVVGGVIDVDHSQKPLTEIALCPDWINGLLGVPIPEAKMVEMLTPLGFVCENGVVTIPTWRADVENKADLAEEVARLYGYDNIPSSVVTGAAQAQLTPYQKLSNQVTELLLAQGFYEIITYSFISPKYYDKINLPASSLLRNSVAIRNPLGEETSILRSTTLPSMLEVLARNYRGRSESAQLFELATEYTPSGSVQPFEKQQITLGMYGEGFDFYTLKGVVETLLQRLRVKDWDIDAASDDTAFHPGRCAVLTVGGKRAGIFGEAHPSVLANYDIGTRAYLAKLDMELLFEHREEAVLYRPMPKYPAVSRAIAVVCEDAMASKQVRDAICTAAGKLLESVSLFDLYRGAQIPADKKSLAYDLVLRSHDRTLTDEEIERVMKKIIKALNQLGAGIRE